MDPVDLFNCKTYTYVKYLLSFINNVYSFRIKPVYSIPLTFYCH